MNANVTTPQVHPFHHADTGTWSYVVADVDSGQAAIIDPVLDFDAKSGRIAHTSAQQLLACVAEHGYQVRWLLETHAHADHLTAAQWLATQLPDAMVAIGQGIREVQRTFAPVFDLDEDGVAHHFDCLFGDGDEFIARGLQRQGEEGDLKIEKIGARLKRTLGDLVHLGMGQAW